MDGVRIGLQMRALRRRRRWTQRHLAEAAEVSRSVVGRIEGGQVHRVAAPTLIRVAAALGATVSIRILWHGEALDRLLDAGHADLVERTLALLKSWSWDCATEVSFSIAGERGSIDILAFHAPTGTLVVIEVKSVVPDMQAMLHGIDRKARLGPRIAGDRGWKVATVARLLVLPDDRTVRRRVRQHATTLELALPARTIAVKRWLRAPAGPMSGILFLPDDRQAVPRHRVASPTDNGHAQE